MARLKKIRKSWRREKKKLKLWVINLKKKRMKIIKKILTFTSKDKNVKSLKEISKMLKRICRERWNLILMKSPNFFMTLNNSKLKLLKSSKNFLSSMRSFDQITKNYRKPYKFWWSKMGKWKWLLDRQNMVELTMKLKVNLLSELTTSMLRLKVLWLTLNKNLDQNLN